MIMEGGDKDMEVDVIMQLDDKSIRTKINQVMEDRNQHDFKHVTNQTSSHV